MKKYILPVVLLTLLAGCGKVKVSEVDSHIEIVSGTASSTIKEVTTSETETTTERGDKKTTTTKKAGEKISGTTTTAAKASGRVVTRASGGNSVIHGTTRIVPTAPRSTSRTTTSATSTQQPSTQPATFDPKDYSSLTFDFKSDKPDKLEVIRPYSDGRSHSCQTLIIDTSEIKEKLEKNSNKTINDFIEKIDLDGDGYPDLFVKEKEDELNTSGKYFRYDPDKGKYDDWDELNALKYEIKKDSASNRLIVLDKKEDKIEYEKKSYEWNSQNALVLREYIHQYTASNGDILIDYINYDASGAEVSRETRDSEGNLIGENTQPTSEEQNEE
ncbi:hypothetical protein [Ruminococcus sp.]|uniref:hypothetical protein n=1 Tax=Ruminococcus sp. TaxID=41978 RepID=UPI0025E00B3F|nr:hypothetical protein [Ruminococcus sp.]MCR4640078.1 hypothetical protein [Ruminococcus sp.]